MWGRPSARSSPVLSHRSATSGSRTRRRKCFPKLPRVPERRDHAAISCSRRTASPWPGPTRTAPRSIGSRKAKPLPRTGRGARWPADLGGLRVFALGLRRDVRIISGRLLLRCLVHLKARLALPFALQLVLDVEGQPAEAFGLDLDLIAIYEGVEASMVCTGCANVAWLQRLSRGQPFDAARDLMPHVVGVEVLHQRAIVPQPDLKFLRIPDLVLGDDVRPDRRKGVARLHLEEDVAGRRQAARRTVDEVGVAKDVIHRVGSLNMAGALADDDGHLGFALEDRRRHIR